MNNRAGLPPNTKKALLLLGFLGLTLFLYLLLAGNNPDPVVEVIEPDQPSKVICPSPPVAPSCPPSEVVETENLSWGKQVTLNFKKYDPFENPFVPICAGPASVGSDLPKIMMSWPSYPHFGKSECQKSLNGQASELGHYSHYAHAMKLTPEGSIFFDVGANVGLSGLPVAALGYKVVGFEPIKKNWEKLAQSIVLNGYTDHFHLVRAAVGDTRKKIKIYAPPGREDNASGNSQSAVANVGGSAQPEEVQTETIDQWLEDNKDLVPDPSKIVYLKVDIQGYELFALRGAEKLLRDNKDTLFVEAEYDVKLQGPAGVKGADLLYFMHSLGYDAYQATKIIPVSSYSTFQGNGGDISFVASGNAIGLEML